jgi:hypothetical protein
MTYCRQCHFFRKLKANHSSGTCSVKFQAGQPCVVNGNDPRCMAWFIPRKEQAHMERPYERSHLHK